MASAALIVKDDGSFEATPELREVLHMQPGTRLELVEREGDEVRFRVPAGSEDLQGWRSLRGMLADSPVDLNEERRKERERELAAENRWHE
jgi:bifunctional DNA-binding transcriptional regulator/antitoxin component of YhaV-PrlF toxin-antitoxin module